MSHTYLNLSYVQTNLQILNYVRYVLILTQSSFSKLQGYDEAWYICHWYARMFIILGMFTFILATDLFSISGMRIHW